MTDRLTGWAGCWLELQAPTRSGFRLGWLLSHILALTVRRCLETLQVLDEQLQFAVALLA